jgi:hypothetical protein
MSPLTAYRNLLDLSWDMLKLVREQDSEALLELEIRRAAIINNLPDRLPTLLPSEREELQSIIREIRDCDAKVLDYALPWRDHLRKLLLHAKAPG